METAPIVIRDAGSLMCWLLRVQHMLYQDGFSYNFIARYQEQVFLGILCGSSLSHLEVVDLIAAFAGYRHYLEHVHRVFPTVWTPSWH